MQDLLLIHILTSGQLRHYTSNRGLALLYSASDDTLYPTPPEWVDLGVVWELIHNNRLSWVVGAETKTTDGLYTAKPVDPITALKVLARCNLNQTVQLQSQFA